jgi:hypothetical protein
MRRDTPTRENVSMVVLQVRDATIVAQQHWRVARCGYCRSASGDTLIIVLESHTARNARARVRLIRDGQGALIIFWDSKN